MIPDVRGTADPVAQLGEGEHGAEHLGPERRADVGIGRGAAAEDSAEVEHLDRVAHRDPCRHLAGVAAERPPGAEVPASTSPARSDTIRPVTSSTVL